jgi:hypothetical protein
MNLTIHLHQGQECMELYLHSPIHFHGMVFNEAQDKTGQLYLYCVEHNHGAQHPHNERKQHNFDLAAP